MWVKLDIQTPKIGTMQAVSVQDKALLVANIDNQLFCADNHCPHEDIALTLGCLKGQRVKCSLHGFSFDLNDGSPDEEGIDYLKTYPIKKDKKNIFIQL